jgi:Holliday junction resolvase RusA-like endonuclease
MSERISFHIVYRNARSSGRRHNLLDSICYQPVRGVSLMSYWLTRFPLPPSENERLAHRRGQGSMFNSKVWKQFLNTVDMYQLQNQLRLEALSGELKKSLAQGFVLSVDCYFVFYSDRVFYKPSMKVKQLDPDNRLKGALDGLARILDIDDKYFFAGHREKVITHQEAEECTMVRIATHKVRTISQIRMIANQRGF